jgi:ABC-2 type transport system permease protein
MPSHTLSFFSWKKKRDKYLEIVKVQIKNTTTYVVNLFSRGFVIFMRIWVFTQLYTVTYRVAGATRIDDFTLPMLIWTLMITQSFQNSTRPYVARIIEEEVKTGSLAYTLNRPYSYLLFHYAGFLGRILPSLLTNILVGIGVCLILVGPITFTLSGLAGGTVLLILGYLIEFSLMLSIGLLSFWVEDVSAFVWIYTKGQLVLGGVLLPLTLFPDYLRKITEMLPFAAVFYTPAKLMVSFQPETFWYYLTIQLFWVLLSILTAVFLYRKGIKHVSINGG